MQKKESHINWIQVIQKISLLFVLLIYLIIPFKNHFLKTAHFVSHVVSFENPNHSHEHSDHAYAHFPEDGHGHEQEHEHHHHQLDVLQRILHEFEEEDETLPNELLNFRFQVEVPSEMVKVSDQFVLQYENIFKPLLILALTGPAFDVPVPPP